MEKFNIEITNWKWESKILKITKGDSYTCDDLSSKITELELLVYDKINHIRTLHKNELYPRRYPTTTYNIDTIHQYTPEKYIEF